MTKANVKPLKIPNLNQRHPCGRCGFKDSRLTTAKGYKPHVEQVFAKWKKPDEFHKVFEITYLRCGFEVTGDTIQETMNLWRFEGLDPANMKDECDKCGADVRVFPFPVSCPDCGGTGELGRFMDCGHCTGAGTIDRESCKACLGSMLDGAIDADFSD